MTKHEFLSDLQKHLAVLPQKDIEASVDYYREMIDDRMDDGMGEEEAVAAIGTPQKAAEDVLSEIPLKELIKNSVRPAHKMRAWEIVLLIVGSPIWFSLLVAAFAVFFSLYAVLWAVLATFYAASAAIGIGGLASVLLPIDYFIQGNVGAALLILGAGLFLLGLAFFAFYGTYLATRATCVFTKFIFRKIKSCFVRKEK